MEKNRETMEERVWQRIAGQPMPERGQVQQVLYLAMEQVSAFRHLAEGLNGKPQRLAKQLHTEGEKNVHILKGIRRISGGFSPEMRSAPMPKVQPARLVEQCFHRSGRLLTEYASRALDPEFGTVWQILADRERVSAAQLAELAGMLESSPGR